MVPSDSKLEVHAATDLGKTEFKKIAISEPSSVPVGIYSKEYLTKIGLWERVAEKIIPTQNVRASLAAVESGNVEAGFVYKTDALISKKVKIALEIPAAEGPKITYPVVAVAASTDLAAAKKLLAYLKSEPALAVFRKYGFGVQ